MPDRQRTSDQRPQVIAEATTRSARYIEAIGERQVFPAERAISGLEALSSPLPDQPSDPIDVLRLLDEVGFAATVASAGPRYFGFVTGGTLPAALGANMLAAAWDQNSAYEVMSPVAAHLEATAGAWILNLLGLPAESGVGFASGATMGNLTALAAARHSVLAAQGWNVEERGLFGAPEISVLVGEEVHVSVLKALALLGLGRSRVVRVPVDGQGRLRSDGLPKLDAATIVCVQAGNVNTGSFDPVGEVCDAAHKAGAWVHVDGAFGLWALASPGLANLASGVARADSWSTDAHKWLNVPYDCGIAIVRDAAKLRAAMAATAAYLVGGTGRDGAAVVPEMSRRARGIEVWAALRSLGRSGVADMVERCCVLAGRFASAMRKAGLEVLNDVALNQVLVSLGDSERTNRIIAAVQKDGTCWCGGTVWQGRPAMRFSVSSWATRESDVDRSAEAVIRVVRSNS